MTTGRQTECTDTRRIDVVFLCISPKPPHGTFYVMQLSREWIFCLWTYFYTGQTVVYTYGDIISLCSLFNICCLSRSCGPPAPVNKYQSRIRSFTFPRSGEIEFQIDSIDRAKYDSILKNE